MALIEKLKAIGDAIRDRTGTTDEMTLDEMAETIGSMNVGGGGDDNTYILVDENGYEVPAVLVDEPVMLTATPNDVRIGTTAVTEQGVITGEKEIPSYVSSEGAVRIPAGETLSISMFSDLCKYTKLQAIVCAYNTSLANSVAAEKISVNDAVYAVNSTIALSSISVNEEKQTIDFGLTNTGSSPVVIRYFTLKEEE